MLLLAVLLVSSEWARAQRVGTSPPKRVALLIGNAAYGQGLPRLRYPTEDVALVQKSLEQIGFQVILAKDADRQQIGRELQRFTVAAQGADVALVYYSGHGVQSREQNFLIPVGAAIASEADLEFHAVSLRSVMRQLEEAAPAASIVVLDACRDNPLPARTKNLGKGLGRIKERTANTLVVFAAEADTTAVDNGVFASALAHHLLKPGLGLRAVFDHVGAAVRQATAQAQNIERLDRLEGDIVLLPPVEPAAATGTWQDLRARDAQQQRWLSEFLTADDGELSTDRFERRLHALVRDGNALAAAELLKNFGRPDDDLLHKAIRELAPSGLSAMRRLAELNQSRAVAWLSELYLHGDRDLEVSEDRPQGLRLLEQGLRHRDARALWVASGEATERDERVRLMTELSRLGRHRYACMAIVGSHWRDPGNTDIWSLAYSFKDRGIKSFRMAAVGSTYSAVGYPTGRMAVDWMSRAVDLGCEAASAFAVGHAYDPFTPLEPGVSKDARKALDYYQKPQAQADDVGGWVPYRIFVLQALGVPGAVAADPARAKAQLARLFRSTEAEPWWMLDDMLQNARLANGPFAADFVDQYVRWMLSFDKDTKESGQVVNEAKRLANADASRGRTAARWLCQRANELGNLPCRQWLAQN